MAGFFGLFIYSTDIYQVLTILRDFPGGSAVKNPPANAGDAGDLGFIPGSGRFPGGGHGNPLVFLPVEPYGLRSLTDYSPYGREESDTTEVTEQHACRELSSGRKRLEML